MADDLVSALRDLESLAPDFIRQYDRAVRERDERRDDEDAEREADDE